MTFNYKRCKISIKVLIIQINDLLLQEIFHSEKIIKVCNPKDCIYHPELDLHRFRLL